MPMLLSVRMMRVSLLTLGTAALAACHSDSSNAPAPFAGAALSSRLRTE